MHTGLPAATSSTTTETNNFDLSSKSIKQNEGSIAESASIHSKNQQSLNNTTTGSGAYAIASSTTLLYITSPNSTAVQGSSQQLTPISSHKSQNKEQFAFPSSYNTAEKLAAAAAAAVSSAAASVVEIPNFGEGLTSIMDHTRMVCSRFDILLLK